MGKYIKTYLNAVEQLLADENRSVDMRALKKEHEKQIGFIQHERLIHLIVTVMVVIVLFISIVIYFITAITGFAFVCGLLLALTFAYLAYYFFIENTTQKLYTQYNRICLEIEKQSAEKTNIDTLYDKKPLTKIAGL